MKKAKLSPGMVFMVPLQDYGFAWGILTRADQKGRAFGYFFGPRVSGVEEIDLQTVRPENSILACRFGDLGILQGDWPAVGSLENFEMKDWPLPSMSRIDHDSGRAWISWYDDNLHCIEESEVNIEEAASHISASLMGFGAVEFQLTRILT
ncbi:immunity 26/phosphotriesterase HocA family protein [Pseudenhygromyxa sp. WMMC2535]|uniref:immunity 26/phosphotriesterase HocA family protein n=1 Tax=Pseudenhygromyxa sp. WMMC2535 TaxID=2712867 RepID=UPI001551D539|nr:immunity 26/phosphotriesterase HocA family protein [Pseudenhygromyxa sp. WMMC2535]NVB41023.1 immunity 26/phosphotriesterase HocA family protein [Pseudenhygromyxa sp. WMMC2535]